MNVWKTLTPIKSRPLPSLSYKSPSLEEIEAIFESFDSKLLALDFETNGLNWLAPDFKAVGIALSSIDVRGGIYIDIQDSHPSEVTKIMDHLCQYKLMCYNLTFDAGVRERIHMDLGLETTLGPKFNYHCDVMGLIFQMDQGYNLNMSLKTMMKDLLGWPDTNERALDQWLIYNGYTKGSSKDPKPDKGEMWRVPFEIMQKYAALDAQATRDIYYEVLVPAMEKWPDVLPFHTTATIALYKLIIEARKEGITVDVDRLEKWKAHLERTRDEAAEKFTYESEATSHIEEVLKNRVDNKFRPKPKVWLKKDGTMSSHAKRWEEDHKNRYDDLFETHLNLNSKQMIRDILYYNMLGKDKWVVIPHLRTSTYVSDLDDWTPFDKRKRHQITDQRSRWKERKKEYLWELRIDGKSIEFWSAKGEMDCDYAEPPVNKDTAPLFGEAGSYYLTYTKAVKELGYVNKMLERTENGIHHGQLKAHGTLSDRCAGTGGVNLQQLPKSAGYLRCLVPPKDHVIVQADFTALEPVVTAELSKCPSYNALYGDPDKTNDVYLFVGAGVPAFKKDILSLGYDPLNPTKEAISKTKKKFKNLRNICKVVHLAASYGAGVSTILAGLLKNGVDITREEVQEIYDGYWNTFRRIKEFESVLHDECIKGDGVLADGLGMPITIKPKHKDTFNRVIQKTGHSILCKHLYFVRQLIEERGIPMKAYIPNFHDEYLLTVHKDYIKEAEQICYDAVDLTNEWLGGTIKHRCDPEIVANVAEVKVEDYKEAEQGHEFDKLMREKEVI